MKSIKAVSFLASMVAVLLFVGCADKEPVLPVALPTTIEIDAVLASASSTDENVSIKRTRDRDRGSDVYADTDGVVYLTFVETVVAKKMVAADEVGFIFRRTLRPVSNWARNSVAFPLQVYPQGSGYMQIRTARIKKGMSNMWLIEEMKDSLPYAWTRTDIEPTADAVAEMSTIDQFIWNTASLEASREELDTLEREIDYYSTSPEGYIGDVAKRLQELATKRSLLVYKIAVIENKNEELKQ